MDLTNNIIINIYSIILLGIIFFQSFTNDEKDSLQNLIYQRTLQLTIVLLVLDMLSRFDGRPDTLYYAINHIGNFIIFLASPCLPSLWVMYVHINIFKQEKMTKRLIYPLLAINGINVVMVVLTQFFGWYYFIDTNNIYHRGPLFLIASLFTCGLLMVAFIMVLTNRKKIKEEHFFPLVFFPFPPIICIFLQIMFYGNSLILNSVVISLFIVFLNIQNRNMYLDYLTGVNNRKKLDNYLKKKIRESTADKTFSAIMIDLNNFKAINDTFGHDEGDRALIIYAELLKNCLKSSEFISRYGGDEFCIVLDTCNGIELEAITSKIKEFFDKYNQSGERPYEFGFSMGSAIYDYHSHMKAEEFQKQIDILLYENKQGRGKGYKEYPI